MYKRILFIFMIILCNTRALYTMNIRCTMPIIAALQHAEDNGLVSSGRWPWLAHYEQDRVKDIFHCPTEYHFPKIMEHNFSDKELYAHTTHNVIVGRTCFRGINAFLKEKNFAIALDRHTTEDQIGIIAIMRIASKWDAKKIFKDSILYGEQSHPVIKATLTRHVPSYVDPCVELATDNGKDVIYVSPAACVPLVNVDSKADVNWVHGLSKPISGNGQYEEFFIDQAEQQVKFRIDEHGMLLESAVAITMRRLNVPKIVALVADYRKRTIQQSDEEQKKLVDSSALFYKMQRAGVAEPLFEGYIDHTAAKNKNS